MTRRPTDPSRAARPRRSGYRLAAAALACSILAAPRPAAAQDFMFGAPKAWLKVQGGMNFANAGSDLFDEWTTRLTLDKSDFHGLGVAAEAGVPIDERFALVIAGRYSASSAESEYVEWVGDDDLPILQDTRLTIAPVTAGLRFNLIPAGRSISEFAWIPAPFVPYVGAAAGFAYYMFVQEGEFVDEPEPGTEQEEGIQIFLDRLESSGWGATAHVFAGADFTLNRRLALGLEARYAFGSADLDPFRYDGYEPIDLSGLWTSVGLTVRF